MRTLTALVVLVVALAISVPAAFATTGTGSGDGLTVTVTLTDIATAGEPFTVGESITNTTDRGKFVRVTQTLAGPEGTIFSFSYPLFVPQQSLAFNLTFTFPEVPPGTYSLTLRANSASATATTTVVP